MHLNTKFIQRVWEILYKPNFIFTTRASLHYKHLLKQNTADDLQMLPI